MKSLVSQLLASVRNVELFASSDNRAYVILPGGRVVALRSHEFRQYVFADFDVRHPNVSISPQAYHTFLLHLEARALEARRETVYRRVGALRSSQIIPDSILIDLNDGSPNRIRIEPEDWAVEFSDIPFESS